MANIIQLSKLNRPNSVQSGPIRWLLQPGHVCTSTRVLHALVRVKMRVSTRSVGLVKSAKNRGLEQRQELVGVSGMTSGFVAIGSGVGRSHSRFIWHQIGGGIGR